MNERLNTAGKIGLSIAMGAAGVNTIAADYYTGDQLFIPKLVIDALNDKNCNFKNASGESIIVEFPETAEVTIEDELHAVARKAAEDNGLTLVDSSPYSATIKSADTSDEILEALNSYTENFGLNVTLPHDHKLDDFPVRFTSFDDEPQVDNFKKNVTNLVDDLSFMPVEVVRLGEVKEIRIVRKLYRSLFPESYFSDEKVQGKYNFATRIVYLDAGSISETMFHELSHAIEHSTCGNIGAFNNSFYDGINPNGFRYGDLNQKFDEITVSKYALNSPSEDRAEIMEKLGFPYLKQDPSELPPIIRKKLSQEIEYLGKLVPGYQDYWMTISQASQSLKDDS